MSLIEIVIILLLFNLKSCLSSWQDLSILVNKFFFAYFGH